MKYLKFFFFLFYVAFIQNVNAADYIVEASVLNVRSCAGTNCKIVGKLKHGDIVKSTDEFNEWVKIENHQVSGFVVKRALSEDNSISFTPLILLILAIWLAITIYMLPAQMAKGNKNAHKIFLVNLFLGWIPIVWLVLLLAALIGEAKDDD